MNTIWLKIAGLVLVVVIVLVVLGRMGGNKSAPESQTPAQTEPAQKPKTFYDMADRDKQFAQVPKPAEPQPTEQQPAAATPPVPQPPQQPSPSPPQPAAGRYVLPSSITQRVTLYFKPLSEEDDIAAQQLLPWAATSRSISRLPMMSEGPMVRACRDILARWPDSSYAFRAKQMLEDIYERHGAAYNITQQELDISRFLKPGPGTQPVAVEPLRR